MPHGQLDRPHRRVQFARSGPLPFPGEVLPDLAAGARERRDQAPHRHPARPARGLHQPLLGVLQRQSQRSSRQLVGHRDHQRLQRVPRQRPTQLGGVDRQRELRTRHRQQLLVTRGTACSSTRSEAKFNGATRYRLLMTTDPGDLVLDPTCGSGTTAYVAEQWGRRWITIDTSRVALALARTRLMAAKYPYYLMADTPEGQRREAELTGASRPSGG